MDAFALDAFTQALATLEIGLAHAVEVFKPEHDTDLILAAISARNAITRLLSELEKRGADSGRR